MTAVEYKMWNALELFLCQFRAFIVNQLDPENKGEWEPIFRDSLVFKKYNGFPKNSQKKKNWIASIIGKKDTELVDEIDYQHLEVFTKNQESILYPIFKKEVFHLPTWLHEIGFVRNRIAHFKRVPEQDIIIALYYIQRIAKIIEDNKLQNGLEEIINSMHIEGYIEKLSIVTKDSKVLASNGLLGDNQNKTNGNFNEDSTHLSAIIHQEKLIKRSLEKSDSSNPLNFENKVKKM